MDKFFIGFLITGIGSCLVLFGAILMSRAHIEGIREATDETFNMVVKRVQELGYPVVLEKKKMEEDVK